MGLHVAAGIGRENRLDQINYCFLWGQILYEVAFDFLYPLVFMRLFSIVEEKV